MNTRIIDEILATHEQGFEFRGWVEMDKLATELRALLAERERLAGEVTEWEGHAQTYEAGMVAAQRELAHMTKQAKDAWSAAESYRVKAEAAPTPSRRLREYKGVTYRGERWWHAGTAFESVAALIHTRNLHTDADHAALLALRDDPEYPVETLESIEAAVIDLANEGNWVRRSYKAHALRDKLRAWLATQPQAITPEQAVAVLVAHGGKKARLNDVWYCSRISEKERHVLVLPPATPESGK